MHDACGALFCGLCVCGLKSERTSHFRAASARLLRLLVACVFLAGGGARLATFSLSTAVCVPARARAWSARVFVNLLYPTLPRGVCVFYQSVRPSPLVKFGRRAMAGSSFSALLRAVARAPVLCLLSECVVATGVVARAALAWFTAAPFSRSALEVCRRFSRQRSRLPVPFCASRPRLAHPRASRCAFARSSRGSACVARALASTLLFALVDQRRRRSSPDCLCAAHVAG